MSENQTTTTNSVVTTTTTSFETTLLKTFFDMTTHLKIFHWQTEYFSHHKSTDELVSELLEGMDEFLEIYQGMIGHRVSIDSSSLTISNMNKKKILSKMKKFISYLGVVETIIPKRTQTKKKENFNGLLNLRDELIGKVQQTMYLLTFV
uniref:Uncharacterized protein n=1 Tax=viral metagenome TaxID=1070528 RepID=A0A6C0CZK2_9ZZZZ